MHDSWPMAISFSGSYVKKHSIRQQTAMLDGEQAEGSSTGIQLSTPSTSARQMKSLRSANTPANYDRLEGGYSSGTGSLRLSSSSTNSMMRRSVWWKRIAIGTFVVLALVFFFGGSKHASSVTASSNSSSSSSKKTEPQQPQRIPGVDIVDLPPSKPPPSPPSPPPAVGVHPHSYETDPDPSKTTYCTTPHSPMTLPLVQYALMIDAGSTGSRIHIYKFNHCAAKGASYEYETFKMTQPGLSSFASSSSDGPAQAARSLDVLLDEAMRVVPRHLRSCTPVAVKATAGLRFLPGDQSEQILKAVEERIRSRYPFVLDPGGVVVMDGKDEGVYAWITANYLLGTIGAAHDLGAGTYAVLDLGGASTQIVFEPVFTKPGTRLEEGEHKYELKFGLGGGPSAPRHSLYQHSYLGYGLMRARKHVHQLVDFMASVRATPPSEREKTAGVVGNPCLAKGTRRVVEIVDGQTKVPRNVTMDGDDIGSFEACDRIVQLVLAKDAICELKPCSFNGVYQPSLLDSFQNGKVLLLSYFYDRIHPLLVPAAAPEPSPSSSSSSSTKPAAAEKLTVSTIASLARIVCEGRSAWLSSSGWADSPAAMEELDGRPEYCLDLTFMHAILRMGYGFEDEREVRIEKQVRGTELGWCLGATIELVGEGQLSCRDGLAEEEEEED